MTCLPQDNTTPPKTHSARRLVLPLLATIFCATVFLRSAQAEEPLYEQEPYDLITLNPQNDNKVLKVEPLDLPDRRLPQNPRRSRKLEVVLVDEPGKVYELRWGSIVRVDLFEQLVLNKAIELVKEERWEEAFDYYAHLENKDPGLPGLAEGIEAYLYRLAGTCHNKGQYDAALAMLRELYRRNPKHPKVEAALATATDKLIEEYLAKENFSAARTLLHNLVAWFPRQPLAAKWESSLKQQAAESLAQAQKALQAGQFRQADLACSRMMEVWPELPGAKELIESIHKRYPRVVVAVSVPAAECRVCLLDDWATRRSSRLLYRTLMEYGGPGSEGGTYNCPVGQMQITDLGRRLTFQIAPDIHWSQGDAALTGGDVARRLLALADPGDPAYRIGWGELLGSVAVQSVYRVEAELRRPHVRPDAMLQTILPAYNDPSLSKQPYLPNGPYSIRSQAEEETIYVANKHYFAAGLTQPKEVVERPFPGGKPPVIALRSGRVHVLDRVFPWNLDDVRSIETVVVEPYAVPLVHLLIPNIRKPLMARRTFRRGLLFGIDREAILRHLLGGKHLPSCRVISGPFPPGESFNDPLGYAYDVDIDSRSYQPYLAIALVGVAVDQEKRAALKRQNGQKKKPVTGTQKKQPQKSKNKHTPSKPLAKLVLAHPPHEIARVACDIIKRQLKHIHVSVTLKELPPGRLDRIPDEVDLVYVELPVWEPVTDARVLLGESGPSGGATPYMKLALRQLQQATDWREIRAKLRQIHRIAHNDVAVLPLWQLTDFYARHRSLHGVGTRPVTLYQNIEQWKISLQDTTEAR